MGIVVVAAAHGMLRLEHRCSRFAAFADPSIKFPVRSEECAWKRRASSRPSGGTPPRHGVPVFSARVSVMWLSPMSATNVLLDAADEIERGMERLVVLRPRVNFVHCRGGAPAMRGGRTGRRQALGKGGM